MTPSTPGTRVAAVVCTLAGAALALELLVTSALFADAGGFYLNAMEEIEAFRVLADRSWSEMSSALRATPSNRARRRATGCDCARGPRGRPGRPGEPGHDGTDGQAGVPGISMRADPELYCIQCPDGGPGIPGAPGLLGVRGMAGNDGPRGPPGRDGLPGERGGPGERGPPGRDGERGHRGVQGAGAHRGTGARGLPGRVGSRGAPGGRGWSALPGPPGYDGPVGPRGPQGAPGPRGEPGRLGQAGSPGEGYCLCETVLGRAASGVRASSSKLTDDVITSSSSYLTSAYPLDMKRATEAETSGPEQSSDPQFVDLSPTSEPRVVDLSPISEPRVVDLSATSKPQIFDLSAISEPLVVDRSPTSEPQVFDLSPTSEPRVVELTPTSVPRVVDLSLTSEPQVVDLSTTVEPLVTVRVLPADMLRETSSDDEPVARFFATAPPASRPEAGPPSVAPPKVAVDLSSPDFVMSLAMTELTAGDDHALTPPSTVTAHNDKEPADDVKRAVRDLLSDLLHMPSGYDSSHVLKRDAAAAAVPTDHARTPNTDSIMSSRRHRKHRKSHRRRAVERRTTIAVV